MNQVTITAPMPALVWKPAAPDLYVATLDGEFAGYVSALGELHSAHGPHAQHLGSYRSFRTASSALGRWLARAERSSVPPRLPKVALPAGLSDWPAVSPAALRPNRYRLKASKEPLGRLHCPL